MGREGIETLRGNWAKEKERDRTIEVRKKKF